jgi:hypothetical protein
VGRRYSLRAERRRGRRASIATSDAGATVNTTVYGIFGNSWRAKYVVATLAYSGGCTLRVDASASGLMPVGAGT